MLSVSIKRSLFSLVLAIPLLGCGSAHSTPNEPQTLPFIALPMPAQVSYQNELELAKLGQMLGQVKLTQRQRAEVFLQRGIIFDRVGLKGSAYLDFNRALREKPDFAEAHHFIGIYKLQEGSYDEAYESFDSALELNNQLNPVYLFRAIALYYGGRTQLALKDMDRYVALQPNDNYRILWRYLIAAKLNEPQARQILATHLAKDSNTHWSSHLVRYYANEISANELIALAVKNISTEQALTERLCELYFYLGQKELLQHNTTQAANYFKLAVSTNLYDFIEHRYALLELERTAQD